MRTALLCLLLLAAGSAGATTVTITLAVDESFEVYLTSDPRLLEGLLGSGSGEENVYTFTAPVTGHGASYLIVHGHDTDTDSQYGGVLAQAWLSDAEYYFAGGLQQISLSGSTWQTFAGAASLFASNTPGNPRGVREEIDPGAWWIWHPTQRNEARVWIMILPTPVPEPATLVMVFAGVAALATVRLRR